MLTGFLFFFMIIHIYIKVSYNLHLNLITGYLLFLALRPDKKKQKICFKRLAIGPFEKKISTSRSQKVPNKAWASAGLENAMLPVGLIRHVFEMMNCGRGPEFESRQGMADKE